MKSRNKLLVFMMAKVDSRVPHGSMLSLIWFNIFINALKRGVNSDVAKFAESY